MCACHLRYDDDEIAQTQSNVYALSVLINAAKQDVDHFRIYQEVSHHPCDLHVLISAIHASGRELVRGGLSNVRFRVTGGAHHVSARNLYDIFIVTDHCTADSTMRTGCGRAFP